MARTIRFGAYLQEVGLRQRAVSYNTLAPRRQGTGPARRAPVTLRPRDVYRLLAPYLSVRLRRQAWAVLPLAAYLALFQILILKQPLANAWSIAAGIAGLVLGLMLFLEGLKEGLMPLAEGVGNRLPARSPLPVVIAVTFVLGIGATFAEPGIAALQAMGSALNASETPYLYALLNAWTPGLLLAIGLCVGAAALLGTLRALNGWSMKPLLLLGVVPALGLTAHVMADPQMQGIVDLAWDCGAAATGPVTVPLLLAMGIGVAAASGKGHSPMSGLGTVALALLLPVTGTLLLALVLVETTTIEEILQGAAVAASATPGGWSRQTPWIEILAALQALVPLVLFLVLVMRFIVGERLHDAARAAWGLGLCLAGLMVFNLGVTHGLAQLGGQSGSTVPAAFTVLPGVGDSPLYPAALGIVIALVFAWFLGFGATLAEPALLALGERVEDLSNGAFPRPLFVYTVSFGVAAGTALGMLKIIFDLPLGWFLLPALVLALVLTLVSSDEFVDIAWDSGGAVTGPVTIPLVLTLGLGFSQAVGANNGFGILALASLCPALAVLVTGLWVRWKVGRRHAFEERELLVTGATA